MGRILAFFQTSQPHLPLLPLVGFIAGILMYFAMPQEPSFLLLAGFLLMDSILIYLTRHVRYIRIFLTIFLFFIGGLFISTTHTLFTHTIFLPHTMQDAVVSGKIESVQPRLNRVQVVLTELNIQNLAKDQTPQKARFTISVKKIRFSDTLKQEMVKEQELLNIQKASSTSKKLNKTEIKKKKTRLSSAKAFMKPGMEIELKVGDIISGEVFLLKPPAVPAGNGAYYQAREMWFEGIGAIGSLSNVVLLERGKEGTTGWIDSLRHKIRKQLQAVFPKETNGVVQALVLGDSGSLTTPVRSLYRTLGLSHILSVSGFHISLIAFLIFIVLRYIFSFIPLSGKTLLFKQLAGILALAGTGLYVLISNAQPPAVRAFIMVSFVFLCLFIDRRALSLYSVAIAAFLILCIKPFLVLSAGFQLSFIAVLSLIVLVQEASIHLNQKLWQHKILLFFVGLIALNIIVTIATTPFVLYHFHQFASYSVVGNLLLSFVFSFAILPLLAMGIFLLPFGLSGIVFICVDWLLQVVHQIGGQIALLPYTMIYLPSFSGWGLACFAFGFIWICLLRGPIRWVGLVIMSLFFLSFVDFTRPDVLIGQGGRVFAVRDESGKLHLSESFRHRFLTDQWLAMNGQDPSLYWEPKRFYPDFVIIRGQKIAFSAQSCADAVFTIEIKKGDYSNCPAPVYTRSELAEITPLELYVTPEKISINSQVWRDQNRPWGFHRDVSSEK